MEKEYKISEDNHRIDSYLAGMDTDYSRAYFQKLIKDGSVLVNDKGVTPAHKLHKGDIVTVKVPEHKVRDFSSIPLEIIYEDKSLLVINKPAGLNVHPAGKYSTETTLLDILSSHITFPTSSPLAGEGKGEGGGRPGIVHRIDKDTSGVMLVAKNESSQFKLMNQFKDREIKKTYLAIVHGKFTEKKGSIDAPIARNSTNRKGFTVGFGRSAYTEFKVLENHNDYSYLEIYPLTGRTHQIRVHLSSIGHPILGDKMYGKRIYDEQAITAARHMLHAYKIQLTHPASGKVLSFTAPIPKDFKAALKILFSGMRH